MTTRQTTTTIAISMLTFALAVTAFAGEKDKATEAKKQDAKAQTEITKQMTLKNQTHCPVMGGAIDSAAFTDIQGQRVYHCCPMCSAKLEADPDKYFKEAAADSILFENIQTTCPVSGEELDPDIFVDFEGRRVFFSSMKCKKTFLEKPAEYLTKMTEQSKKVEKTTAAKSNGHKDHKQNK